MRTPGKLILGIITVATVGLATTACGGKTDSAAPPAASSPSASPSPVDPKAALLASFAALSQTTCSIDIKQGTATGTAKVDPVAKHVQLSITESAPGVTAKLTILAIDPDIWVKADLGAVLNGQLKLKPTKWAKLDPAKLDDDSLPFDPESSTDVLDLAGLFTGVNEVKQVDATHFAGTVDLTKATGNSAPSEDDLKGLGSKATAVPFTATVDDQGRLAELTVDTGDPNTTMKFTISGYGEPQAIQAPPAGDVVPAPPAIYDFLNGK